MLVLTRKRNQRVLIGDAIEVRVLETHGDKVKLGFTAPLEVPIHREIVKLAIEGGCNGVTSTLGVLGIVSRKYAHKIPFFVKLNHNELLSYPNTYDQRMFAHVKQAFDMISPDNVSSSVTLQLPFLPP